MDRTFRYRGAAYEHEPLVIRVRENDATGGVTINVEDRTNGLDSIFVNGHEYKRT